MKKTFTNKQTTHKLAAYSAMAGAFVLATTGANGQILYTDVDPDETYESDGDFYELDLNMDGETDFTFAILDITYPGAFYTITSGATFAGIFQFIWGNAYNGSIAGSTQSSGGYVYKFPYALNAGADIDDALSFQSGSYQSMAGFIGVASFPAPGSTYSFAVLGEWTGKEDKYLGLRLSDGGDDYYGWARFDVDDNHHEFTIKDYAVQENAETSIEAGATVNVHTVIQSSELTAYSYDNTINVVVKDLHTTGATVKVYNMNGQVVYSNDLNMSGMTITLDNAATGNYTLQVVTEENAVFTKKLFIQN